MITRPGSPCVLSNRLTSIEPALDAENDWVETVHEAGHTTLYPLTESCYTGTDIPRKVRMFGPYAGGVGTYRPSCEDVVKDDYDGFVFAGLDAASPVDERSATTEVSIGGPG